MHLQEIIVCPVYSSEEPIFQELMQAHHYLGALPKIGNTLWYVEKPGYRTDRADNHRCGRVYPPLPAACVAKRLYADPALWSVRKPVQT